VWISIRPSSASRLSALYSAPCSTTAERLQRIQHCDIKRNSRVRNDLSCRHESRGSESSSRFVLTNRKPVIFGFGMSAGTSSRWTCRSLHYIQTSDSSRSYNPHRGTLQLLASQDLTATDEKSRKLQQEAAVKGGAQWPLIYRHPVPAAKRDMEHNRQKGRAWFNGTTILGVRSGHDSLRGQQGCAGKHSTSQEFVVAASNAPGEAAGGAHWEAALGGPNCAPHSPFTSRS